MIFKPRTRMIAFRVSEDEYDRLHRMCVLVGARSISDLARNAVSRLGGQAEEPDSILDQVASLGRSVNDLTCKVEQLSERLAEMERDADPHRCLAAR